MRSGLAWGRRLHTGVVVVALAAATACGSTVQQDSLQAGAASPSGDGLTGLEAPSADGDGLTPADAGRTEDGGATGTAAGTPTAPGATAPDAASRPGAPATGTPEQPPAGAVDTSPLRLGLLYVNNDAASGAGVSNGDTFSPRRGLEAFVAASNARGGLAGRRLEPTYFELKSSSSNYASDLQAACAQFVDDADVSVVMSFLGITDEQFSSCLAKAGVAHVNGSYGLGDQTSMAAHPTTVSTEALSVDRRSAALLQRLTASGHLTRTSRIGVVIEGCPYNQRAVERTLLPTAERLGLSIVETHTTRCFGGINDLSGLAADSQNAVLRFNARDVDRVVIVSSVESNVMLVFTTAAESQAYRPGYALTSLALGNVLKDNVPKQQLTNAKGLGWLPAMDDTASLTPTPRTQECVKAVQAHGVSPVSRVDHFTVFSQCDTFSLTERALTASRGATGPAQWSAALDAVGTSLRSAATLEGRTDFSAGRRDGPALGRTFAWDGGCSCFRYTGGSYPL